MTRTKTTIESLQLHLREQREKELKEQVREDRLDTLYQLSGVLFIIALFLFLSWLDPEFVRCMFLLQCKQS